MAKLVDAVEVDCIRMESSEGRAQSKTCGKVD
jgi:hypothetical protein